MGEPIAINHLAIWEILDRYGETFGIDNKLECFMQINRIFSILMSERREKNKLGQAGGGVTAKRPRKF